MAMIAVAVAAVALWRYGGLTIWLAMRNGLFLAALPVALFTVAAVIGFLRPARTPAKEKPEAD